jgi:hypothetical protein
LFHTTLPLVLIEYHENLTKVIQTDIAMYFII